MENQYMKLTNKVLAFKLLDPATISENHWQMCLTLATDLTVNGMKTALKRISSYKTNTSKDAINEFENFDIKQEVDQNTKLRGK